jgi:hypothetical protein
MSQTAHAACPRLWRTTKNTWPLGADQRIPGRPWNHTARPSWCDVCNILDIGVASGTDRIPVT